jgi:hypothetical protein
MSTPKVYADFQNLDDDNRLRLTSVGTLQDLKRLGIDLSEDLVLTFYTDDADEGCWVAAINWTAIHHASDGAGALRGAPAHSDDGVR